MGKSDAAPPELVIVESQDLPILELEPEFPTLRGFASLSLPIKGREDQRPAQPFAGALPRVACGINARIRRAKLFRATSFSLSGPMA